MKKAKAKAHDFTLIGKFEIAGAKIWVRRCYGLAVWVEPRSITPTFSQEMRRWRALVGAQRDRFFWKVDKENADKALMLILQMLGDPGSR